MPWQRALDQFVYRSPDRTLYVLPDGPSSLSFRAALATDGIGFALNVRGGMEEWRRAEDAAWSMSRDGMELSEWYRETVAAGFKFAVVRKQGAYFTKAKYGPDDWKRSRAHTAVLDGYHWDPFLAYLESLPAWDQHPRLEGMLATLFGADTGSDLNRWAARATLVAAVVRARTPGAKIDTIPVLTGRQGLGKSSLYLQAFPDTGRWAGRRLQWYSDALDLTGTLKSKELQEGLQGRVIVEIPELSGMQIRNLEALKKFLVSLDDGSARKAFRRDPSLLPRRATMFATSNEDTPLPNDPSGHRRYVVVPCRHGANVEAWWADNRAQLWAEAVAMVDAGDDGRLDRELLEAQTQCNEPYRHADEPIVEAIAALDPNEGYSIRGIAQTSGLVPMVSRGKDEPAAPDWSRFSGSVPNGIVRELKAAGWYRAERRRKRSARLWIWRHPDALRR